MTYGRIESYRGFAFMQSQFKEYMEHAERLDANKAAQNRYIKEKASTKKGSDAAKNKSSSLLSFNLFIDKEERDKQSDKIPLQITLAKNLMFFLYGDQPFFISMQEKRSNFLDEIFAALIKASDNFTKEQKLNRNKAEEIATIDLGDMELNDVFAKMLRGSIEEVGNVDINTNPTPSFKPTRGYYPLLDFLTIARDKLKIRVFLASPQLLMAIYGNADIVRQILDARKNLYNDVVAGPTKEAPATQSFQAQFQNSQLPEIPNDILDFSVSKTRPSNGK